MENKQNQDSKEEPVSLEKIINELPKEEKDKFVAGKPPIQRKVG